MLQVCCAIIERDGKVLVVQRSTSMTHPLKWEFPGGKLNPGELPKACVAREVHEELGMTVEIRKQLTPVIHQYPERTVQLTPFICTTRVEPVLTEHIAYLWLQPTELSAIDWLEADVEVLNNYIVDLKKESLDRRV